MPKLQNMLMLTDKGYKQLKKAIAACTLSNFALMLPFVVAVRLVMELIKPLSGAEISWNMMWLWFGTGIVSVIIIFLCNQLDYKRTYENSYFESKSARIAIAEHMRKLPMSLFNSKDLTELTTNFMGDISSGEQVLSHIVPQLIANIISATVTSVMLAILDWRMALAIFIFVPVAFGILLLSRKISGRLNKKHMEAKLAAAERVQEYIEGIKVIRACNMDGEKFSVLENALRAMKKIAVEMELGAGVFVTGAQAILQAGMGFAVLLGVTLLTGGHIELVPILVFMLVMVRIYGPFLVLLTQFSMLWYYQVAINRMRALMAIKPMEGAKTPLQNTDICFENVSFSYNENSENAVENLSFTLKADTVTALVGPSGSGKSTVSRLIARFWDVNKGKITIGGVDIKTLDPEHLMSYMSFVFQDVVLFNDTIMGNIRIGNMDATDEEVKAAAKAACCDEFISKLAGGYGTILGENGATLSGGERQRISIARALLKNAPIVLLDEATASLDPENESSIQRAISALIKGKTVIIIAHRLRTVMGADNIIVLENGKLIEEGAGKELVAKNGLFAKLYSIQQENLGCAV